MPCRLRDRAWRRLAVAGVALYALFLTTSPFEHHDLWCHLKTPFHCTSCASSPLSSDPSTLDFAGLSHLADAGRAIAVSFDSQGVVLSVPSFGRSPPLRA